MTHPLPQCYHPSLYPLGHPNIIFPKLIGTRKKKLHGSMKERTEYILNQGQIIHSAPSERRYTLIQ